jgi:hypothetical protein
MGAGRFQSKAAERVWLREPEVATPSNGNFASRGQLLIVSNSADHFRAHFS